MPPRARRPVLRFRVAVVSQFSRARAFSFGSQPRNASWGVGWAFSADGTFYATGLPPRPFGGGNGFGHGDVIGVLLEVRARARAPEARGASA